MSSKIGNFRNFNIFILTKVRIGKCCLDLVANARKVNANEFVEGLVKLGGGEVSVELVG